MKDAMTMACVNMKGVLRALVYLCALDGEASAIVKEADITLQFSVKNGPAARLCFRKGQCTFEEGKGDADIKLHFSSPEKFNALMGGKGTPTILKGFMKLGFLLKDFTQLTGRLEHFLRPAPDEAHDEKFWEVSTLLTFYTAFGALPEIGTHDAVGAQVMKKAANGQMVVSVEGTGHAVRVKVGKGVMRVIPESDGSPEMRLSFSDIGTTGDVLAGRTDFLTGIGTGGVRMSGYIPVMMSVEHLVPLLGAYLN